jgi:pilus assembly protein TadC
LAVVAAAAVAVLCVLLLGPLTGGVAGLLAAPAAALGVRRASVPAAVADDSLPLVLDLMAAALRSGRSPAEALWAVAPVTPAHGDRLRRVADLLHLGATPADAWAVVPRDGPLGSVARLAVRSGTSGIRFAAVLEREAAESRATAHAGRIAAAHRAGVRVLAPLGACFLPAFVCLGIVPVIVGVLSSSGLSAVSGAGS